MNDQYVGLVILGMFFGGIWGLSKLYLILDSIRVWWNVDIPTALKQLDQDKLDQDKQASSDERTDGKTGKRFFNLIKFRRRT